MDKQVAILDIGTNTTLLLTARWDPAIQNWTDFHTQQRFTRIGERLKDKGEIPDFVLQRNLDCLKEFHQLCHTQGIQKILAFGTSALRDAANGMSFVQSAKAQFNIDVQIISGEREAELICKSVAALYQDPEQSLYILDIGGGSTELIQWQNQSIQFLKSLNLGVVHLTAQFLAQDLPAAEQIAACRHYLATLFKQQYPAFPPGRLVAIGGTATSAYCLIQNLPRYVADEVEGQRLQLADLETLFQRLSCLPLAQRIQEPHLPPRRADVFLAGLLILIEELKALQLTEILVSDRGLRYGVLAELRHSRINSHPL